VTRRLLLTALLLAGCAVGPDYHRPELAVAPAFRNAPQTAATEDAKPWWQGFGDPLLDRLETEALAANLDLERAAARIAQARGALKGADAALLPAGEADANYARVQQSLNAGLGQLARYVPSYTRTLDNAQLTIGASWEIDFAGERRRQREAARARLRASEADYAATRLAISGELADAYWALRGAQAQQAALTRLIAVTRDQRTIMAARVTAKATPADDLRRADAALSDLESQLPAFAALAEAQRNRIAVLLGRDPSAGVPELAASGAIPEAPDPAAGRPADVVRRRPDVAAAEQQLRAANAGIGAALGEYYPKVTLSALVGQLTNNLANLGSGDSTSAQGAVGLRWRLFDFGRIDAEVRMARGREREARAAYRQTVLLAAESVETGFAQLFAARERLSRLTAERAALAETAASAARAFRVGQISRDDSLDAERLLVRLDIDIAAARRDVARATVACNRAIGAPTL